MNITFKYFIFISIIIAISIVVGFNVCQAGFSSPVNYGIGSNPRFVFTADLDGDNDNDLATANYGSNNVSILLNNGDGTFASAVNYSVGTRPATVYAADLDGDEDKDLIVGNFVSDNVSILLNNGDGTFAAAVNYSAGDGAWSVFASDLDGDDDNDIAVTNSNTTTVSILKNNGDGTFVAAVNYNVQNVPSSVFAADLDGDNDPDLAVSNYFSSTISILDNNGDGTFTAAVNYSITNFPISLFVADLDNDNDYDVATANYDNNNTSVLLNNGNGTFAAAVDYSVGSRPPSVYAADIDSDGDNDLVTANYNSSNVSVLDNNGDGTFASAVNYSAGSGVWSVLATDLDGDVDNDLAMANYDAGSVSILLSNVSNPVPILDSILPTSKILNNQTFTITANGNDFVSTSVIRLNGSNLSTTFVNNTELTAVITPSDIGSAATYYVSVFNPAPQGGTSSSLPFLYKSYNTHLPPEAFYPPISPPSGFGISINNNEPETNLRDVTLALTGGPDTARMAISNDINLDAFGSTGQIPYEPSYTWDICQGYEECPEGTHTVYARFYTTWGQWSETISDSIVYTEKSKREIALPEKICPGNFTRDLRRGIVGEDIRELQKYLNNNDFILAGQGPGSPGNETNYFGQLTQAALTRFQTAKLIAADLGVFDLATRGYLGCLNTEQLKLPSTTNFKFTRDLKLEMIGEDVKELQKFLNNNGFILADHGPGSPGNETNYFGPLTQAALVKFQEANNISPAVGYFGPITRGIVNQTNQ